MQTRRCGLALVLFCVAAVPATPGFGQDTSDRLGQALNLVRQVETPEDFDDAIADQAIARDLKQTSYVDRGLANHKTYDYLLSGGNTIGERVVQKPVRRSDDGSRPAVDDAR